MEGRDAGGKNDLMSSGACCNIVRIQDGRSKQQKEEIEGRESSSIIYYDVLRGGRVERRDRGNRVPE